MREDCDVLSNFFDYVVEKYDDPIPPWAEAFMQVFSWQFQTVHATAEAYYSNEYGDSDYATITRAIAFLQENGYDKIAEPYGLAAVDCEQYQYPEDKIDLLPDGWIETHEQVIWNFYVDIFLTHKIIAADTISAGFSFPGISWLYTPTTILGLSPKSFYR